LVTNLLEGINGALLAYGQTSSGKTYSMFGPSHTKPQVHLFVRITRYRNTCPCIPGCRYTHICAHT